MKVCLYQELEGLLKKSGIGRAVEHQRMALELNDVDWTKDVNDDFDLIHINTIGPKSLYLAKKMKLKGKKVIMHAHTTVEDFRNSFWFSNALAVPLKKYLTYFYNHADMVICTAEYTRRVLMKRGVNTELITISNGINVERFKNIEGKRESSREKYSLDGVVPFSVGHVFARKGVPTFVNVAKKFPNTFMWFGTIYSSLLGSRDMRSLVNNAPKNVIFAGYVDNTIAYSAGDIFFFPSTCEHQPFAVLEAIAARKPILIRDIPAFEGWLVHNENCLKAQDDEDFAQQLQELMDNKRLRKDLSRNAYRMVQTHSLKNVGAMLKEAYERVLNN
jgi:1,2-diacylglycerol-3-alpha-glucose alpha-1,2-glucosyltransferase